MPTATPQPDSSLNAHLEWDDDWLVLHVGCWRMSVADVEDFSDGGFRAHLHGWVNPTSAASMPHIPDDLQNHHHIDDGHRGYIDCLSREEAYAVIRALLAVRGVSAPPHPGPKLRE